MKIKILLSIVVLAAVVFAVSELIKLRAEGAELVREADRFNMPVVNQMMAELSAWDYENLKPYLDEGFMEIFPDEEFQKELDDLSILGDVKNIRHIRHAGHKRYENWLYTLCAVNKYSVSTDFEKGRGNVVFDLNHCHEKVEVTFFQVYSKALPMPDASQP